MDAAQRGFFDKWIQAWSQGVAMHVDGNISYLFAYATSLLTNPNFEKASELIRLADAYQYEIQFSGACRGWASDCYVLVCDYERAIQYFPKLKTGSVSALSAEMLLSLKLAAGKTLSGHDLLSLFGARVTSFGRANLEQVVNYVDLLVAEQQRDSNQNFIEVWATGLATSTYPAFIATTLGSRILKDKTIIPLIKFRDSVPAQDYAKIVVRDAENKVRERSGLPAVQSRPASPPSWYQNKNTLPTETGNHISTDKSVSVEPVDAHQDSRFLTEDDIITKFDLRQDAEFFVTYLREELSLHLQILTKCQSQKTLAAMRTIFFDHLRGFFHQMAEDCDEAFALRASTAMNENLARVMMKAISQLSHADRQADFCAEWAAAWSNVVASFDESDHEIESDLPLLEFFYRRWMKSREAQWLKDCDAVQLQGLSRELGAYRNFLLRKVSSAKKRAGYIDGRHFLDYIPEVEELKRQRRYEDAAALLIRMVDAVEAEAAKEKCGVAPWYYWHLAIVYRKLHRADLELAILERFASQKHPRYGATIAKLLERLKDVRKWTDQTASSSPAC